jgi:hypothetical protein
MTGAMREKTIALGVLDGKEPRLWPPWRKTALDSLLQGLATRRAQWVTVAESAKSRVIVQPELQPLSRLSASASAASVVGVLVDPVGPNASDLLRHQYAVRVEFREFCQALGRMPDAAYRIFGFRLFILPDVARHSTLRPTVAEFTRDLEGIAYFELWGDSKARGCTSYTVESEDWFIMTLGFYIDEVNRTFVQYRESSAP